MVRILPIVLAAWFALSLTSIAQDAAFIQRKIAEWEAVTKASPYDYETWAALGSAYGKLRRYQDALSAFNNAISANPKYAEAYLGLASTYGFLGKIEDKIRYAQKAIDLKPGYADAYANLGSAYGKSGRYKEAVTSLKEAVRLSPQMADAHFALGLSYLSLGDKTSARAEASALASLGSPLSKQLRQLIAK